MAITRIAIDRERQGDLRPLQPDDRRVRPGPHDRVAPHHVVVLGVDLLPAAEIEGRRERLECLGPVGDVLDHVSVQIRERFLPRRAGAGTPVARRVVDQGTGRHVGDLMSLEEHAHAPRVGDPAHDRGAQVPLREHLAHAPLGLRRGHEEHPLLRLRQENFIRGHPFFAQGHLVEVDLHAGAGARRHFDGRAGETGRAHVLDPDDDPGRLHDLETGFEQELLGERVAHLNRRTLRLGGGVELG